MLLLFSALARADQEFETIERAQGVADLYLCREDKLGVELLCNRDWRQEIDRDRAVLMVISQDPAVLLTVARAKEPVTGIEELTDETLKRLGKYADGFKVEHIKVSGLPAVRVEGYSENFPQTHLTDYYVVHDYQLYSFLFSVDPKEEWPDYAVLCAKIIESVKITENK